MGHQRNKRGSTRVWQSAVARELMKMSSDNDPRTAIVQCARNLLEEAQIIAPPVNLELLGSFQRIHTVEAVEMQEAGRLIPDMRGLRVQVNIRHSRGKQRFTIAHEIGHTLIPAYRRAPHAVQDMVTGLFSGGQEEEYLCDVAAAELLLPDHLFRSQASALGCNLDTVVILARQFLASREAIARRLTSMNLWPCAAALWHYAFKPSESAAPHQMVLGETEWTPPQPKLRVRYASASTQFGHYLYPHLSAPPDGLLIQCYTENRVVCGEERLILSNRPVTLYVMAAPTNFLADEGPKREVLSLLLSEAVSQQARVDHADMWTASEDDM